MIGEKTNRRGFCKRVVAGAAAATVAPAVLGEEPPAFKLRYMLASSMYGRLDLSEIVPEVHKAGAEHIDIWPEPHGNQREQMEAMGHGGFAAMLAEHQVKLGILTHYDLGPFGLGSEITVAKKLGASMLICGGQGPKNLTGPPLKSAVRIFAEQMRPHIAAAEEAGLVIGVENHANNLIESTDSMEWLVEFAPSKNIGIALAPYHLPQKPKLLAKLINTLGDRLVHFYAWQHGKGCQEKLPKEEELLQMPGRGDLDFEPIIAALKKIDYRGFTEVFMHPVPRGIPILPTAAEVTAEINRARKYLETCCKAV